MIRAFQSLTAGILIALLAGCAARIHTAGTEMFKPQYLAVLCASDKVGGRDFGHRLAQLAIDGRTFDLRSAPSEFWLTPGPHAITVHTTRKDMRPVDLAFVAKPGERYEIVATGQSSRIACAIRRVGSQENLPEEHPMAELGTVEWTDLTVKDAPRVAAFYEKVLGWKAQSLESEGGDFNMNLPASGKTVAGVCHALGGNAKLPPQWLIYVRVKDVEASAKACEELGGKVVCRLAQTGYVIQDPAGAVMAILPEK